MTGAQDLQQQQDAYWNGPRGDVWSRQRALMDTILRPFEERLAAEVSSLAPASVLDVGCGAGATTLAIKRALGDGAACVGVDLSEALTADARARAREAGLKIEFIRANAGEHDFPDAAFDVLASRFGVMFFADPVAAFSNLRRATRQGGRLVFIVWRGPEENDFMTTGVRAAVPLLPDGSPASQPGDPHAPGPFALGDPARSRALLAESGWDGVAIEPIDVACAFPADRLDLFIEELAPMADDVAALEPELRDRVRAAMREAYGRFVRDGEVRFVAGCQIIRAAAR